MTMARLILFCLFTTLMSGAALAADTVFVNANLVDGTGGEPFPGSIVVRDGRITDVLPAGERRWGTDAEIIDLEGRWILPGLIDAHVHISDSAAAARALQSGVTTARSMGTSNFADVGLRELIRQGAVRGPELLAAGYHVRPRMAEAIFLNEPSLADLIDGVHGPSDFRRVASLNLKRGVDFIKTVATDRAGLPQTDPRRQIMSLEELEAVVSQARQAGVPVAAHAHGSEGADAAVRAGVRSIEHGTYLSDQTLILMSEKGTFLVPTVAVVKDLIDPGGDYDSVVLRVRGRHMYPRIRQTVRQALARGVRVAAATDTGYGPQSILRVQHDMLELIACGMTPMQAIQAATSVAAELLGVSERTGSIQTGLEADLIVIESDPLAEPNHLQDVLLVMSNGEIEVDRLPSN